MNKENIVKGLIVFGGGYMLYLLVRSMKENYKHKPKKQPSNNTQSFDSTTKKPNEEDAKIVMTAYKKALANKEPSNRLSELNKECLKEFGMRCYVNDAGKLVVVDEKGSTILTD